MYENVRGAVELMAQEVGQAGAVSLPSTAPTLSAGVSVSASAQTATISSTTSMFVGEKVIVDTGTNEELVTLTAVSPGTNQIAGIFSVAHASGAPINVMGVFPNGIVAPGTTNGSTGTSTGSYSATVTEPASSVLNLFGDLNADGTLVYVRYTCDTTATPGTLTRSVTTITPGSNTISSSQYLLKTLITNPSGTACFQYTTATAGGYTFVTNIAVTLSVRTVNRDPETNQYVTMTKSFLNLSPRNILTAFKLASSSVTSRLQPTPANVSLY
jgi:hypothetical protein